MAGCVGRASRPGMRKAPGRLSRSSTLFGCIPMTRGGKAKSEAKKYQFFLLEFSRCGIYLNECAQAGARGEGPGRILNACAAAGRFLRPAIFHILAWRKVERGDLLPGTHFHIICHVPSVHTTRTLPPRWDPSHTHCMQT